MPLLAVFIFPALYILSWRLPLDVLFRRKRANVDMRLKVRLVLEFDLRGSPLYSRLRSLMRPCPGSDADEEAGEKEKVEHEKERERGRALCIMPSIVATQLKPGAAVSDLGKCG